MSRRILILLVAIVFVHVACVDSRDQESAEQAIPDQDVSLDKLRIELESQRLIPKEDPFVQRDFKPYRDDEWIGNAVSYGAYRKGQAPGRNGPSEEEILEDLTLITNHWKLIRVYNADDDCERILHVIRKHGFPIKVMIGVWLEGEDRKPEKREANIKNVLRSIELANANPDIVAAINVGNETQVFWTAHGMKAENLIRYIRAVRNHTEVPVTTADDYNFWNKSESKDVAEEVDFIVSHMYAMWNGIVLEHAVEWTDSIYHAVQRFHPEKTVVIGETGWATTYNSEKTGPDEQGTLIKGKVSLQAQEEFLIGLHRWVNENRITTFLFEAFDEPWKGGGEESGPDEVEKHWGVFYEDRTPKKSFQNFLKQINQE